LGSSDYKHAKQLAEDHGIVLRPTSGVFELECYVIEYDNWRKTLDLTRKRILSSVGSPFIDESVWNSDEVLTTAVTMVITKLQLVERGSKELLLSAWQAIKNKAEYAAMLDSNAINSAADSVIIAAAKRIKELEG